MLTLISDMELLADAIEKKAFEMPPPNAYTPQFVELAIIARRLAQEAKQRRSAFVEHLKDRPVNAAYEK